MTLCVIGGSLVAVLMILCVVCRSIDEFLLLVGSPIALLIYCVFYEELLTCYCSIKPYCYANLCVSETLLIFYCSKPDCCNCVYLTVCCIETPLMCCTVLQ